MSAEVKSMTQGKPGKLIFFFAIPLMLGNMFQQFYTIADTLIVSRVLGVNALAALGAADWYNYMMLSVVQAIAQGFSILLALDFGAEKYAHLKKATAHAISLSVILTLLLTAAAQLSLNPVLALLRTPQEVRPMTFLYLRIIFAGIPAQMLFNFGASVLRALGNSRSPLHAMVFSSFMNIGLDLLFVLVFHFGIAGAAVATVMSQAASGIWCLLVIRKIPYLRISRQDFQREKGLDGRLLFLSVPMVLQNVLISVGGMIVEYVANGMGVTFVAGFTATNKLYGAIEMAAVAYGYSMVTYMGQNYGAGRSDRIRKGYRSAILIAIATGAVLGYGMILAGHAVTGAFLTGNSAEANQARQIAFHYLFIVCSTLPILYVLHVTRSALQGLGDTVMPMVSGVAEFAMRTFMALVMTGVLGGVSIMYGEVVAWIGADLILAGALIGRFKKLPAEAGQTAEM